MRLVLGNIWMKTDTRSTLTTFAWIIWREGWIFPDLLTGKNKLEIFCVFPRSPPTLSPFCNLIWTDPLAAKSNPHDQNQQEPTLTSRSIKWPFDNCLRYLGSRCEMNFSNLAIYCLKLGGIFWSETDWLIRGLFKGVLLYTYVGSSGRTHPKANFENSTLNQLPPSRSTNRLVQ